MLWIQNIQIKLYSWLLLDKKNQLEPYLQSILVFEQWENVSKVKKCLIVKLQSQKVCISVIVSKINGRGKEEKRHKRKKIESKVQIA